MLTIIFILSLSLIVMMIGFKSIEEKKRKKFLFSNLRERIDIAVMNIVSSVRKNLSLLNKKNIKFIAVFVGNILKVIALNFKRKLRLRKLRFIDSLRIKGDLKKKRSASFFLKNVSEYKGKYVK